MFRWRSLVWPLWICIVIFSCTGYGQVLARIGNSQITMEEFKKRFSEVRRQAINPPTPEQFLEDLVRYEVGVQEAQRRRLENDPIVKERFRQELYKALIEKSIGENVSKIKVNESEMRAYYAKNPELRTSHILIEFKPDAKPEEKEVAKKRALEILAEVKKSKRPFEELVKLYTDDTLSKNTGGDIGFQSKLTLVPNYYDTALAMKVSEIRGLIETRYGFHIIKLTDRRSYQQANKQQLRTAVFDSKRADLFNEFFEKLKRQYSIEVNKDGVKNFRVE